MASHKSIYNESNGFWMKRGRAEREIGCSVVWVVEGVSVRNMTPLEIYEAMNARAAEIELHSSPLPLPEIRGFQFMPSLTGLLASKLEHRLIIAAKNFAAGMPGY